jgi:hypothetical protein
VDAASGAPWLQGQRSDGGTSAYNLLLNPAGGSVAIGATSATYKLDVQDASTAASFTAGRYISTANPTGESKTSVRIEKGSGYGAEISGYLSQGVGSGMILSTLNGGTSTERMRINHAGGVSINQTATGLQNSNSIDLNAPGATQTINHSGTAAGWSYLVFGYNGAAIGSIGQSGTTGVTFNTSSDYRLKDDPQPIQSPIDKLLRIKPVNFAWKSNGEREDGFIAHELQEVVPQAVSGEKDAVVERDIEVSPAQPEIRDDEGNVIQQAVAAVIEKQTLPDYQGVDKSHLVPLLTAALQDVALRLAEVEARLAVLEAAA